MDCTGYMRHTRIIILILVTLALSTKCDYIVQVFPRCPHSENDPVDIEVKADIKILAQAVCASSRRQNFTRIDDVTYRLRLTLTNSSDSACVFNKRDDSRTYWLNIDIFLFGDVLRGKETRMIMCVLEGIGKAKSESIQLTGSKHTKPKELRNIISEKMVGPVYKLQLYTSDNRVVRAGDVNTAQKVRLVATMTGETKFPGITALDCHVTTSYMIHGVSKTAKKGILASGCGEGDVLAQNQGFWTQGRRSYSPFFDAFHLTGSEYLRFACTFLVCTDTCNGNSCENENLRAKRETALESNLIELQLDFAHVMQSHPIAVVEELT